MLDQKNKLSEFVARFTEENSDFGKCVIIHDYMDFIHKSDKLRSVLQKVINDIPTQITLFTEREVALCEADLFESKIELINNEWIHYVVLTNMFYAIKDFTEASAPRRAYINEEIQKGFVLPYSREQFELSLKAFNKKLFHAIDVEMLVNSSNAQKIITFDEQRSLLSIYGEKVEIAQRNKITVGHTILNYIFIKNSDNLDDDFFYKEIAEDEYSDEDYNWRKYHVACCEIKKKIKEQANKSLDDLLLFDTGRRGKISLNKKYLP